jgi:predicted ATPase
VLWGACYEDSGPPYGPWVEAIDGYLGAVSRERVAELVAGDAAVLASVAPGIRAVLTELPSPAVLSAADGRLRLFVAVARFFERLGEPVLVLDDMQWADASALDLLVQVARLVAGLSIVPWGSHWPGSVACARVDICNWRVSRGRRRGSCWNAQRE